LFREGNCRDGAQNPAGTNFKESDKRREGIRTCTEALVEEALGKKESQEMYIKEQCGPFSPNVGICPCGGGFVKRRRNDPANDSSYLASNKGSEERGVLVRGADNGKGKERKKNREIFWIMF